MKKIFFIIILFVTITLMHAAGNRAFVWADDEAYWPAIYRGKDGKPAGIFNDMWQLILCGRLGKIYFFVVTIQKPVKY